jgi:hypothetical protein
MHTIALVQTAALLVSQAKTVTPRNRADIGWTTFPGV